MENHSWAEMSVYATPEETAFVAYFHAEQESYEGLTLSADRGIGFEMRSASSTLR